METFSSATYNNNEEPMTFSKLKANAQKLERAHKECRGINNKIHGFLGIIMLISSSTVTCLETIVDYSIYKDELHMVRIVMASLVTLVAALSQYFENGKKSEIHHSISREYFSLQINIDKAIIKKENNIIDYLDQYNAIRSSSIGIFGWIRKRYAI